jgi:hypothetical protein
MSDSRWATITIMSGTDASEALTLHDNAVYRSFAVYLYSPMALPESVTVEVTPALDDPDFRTLQTGGQDFVLPAGKCTYLLEMIAAKVRLKADTNVAGDRVFTWRAVGHAVAC